MSKFLLALAGVFSLWLLCNATSSAANQCTIMGCRAYVTTVVTPVVQRTPVWCWAASLSALFGAFGHPTDQTRIVARYFPPPGITTGPPWVLRDALNTTWTDDRGVPFSAVSSITDLYSQTSFQVDNAAIVRALSNGVPVFYGDATHAMVLVQADYQPTVPEPTIIAAAAIDPYPYDLAPYCPPAPYFCHGPGFTPLFQSELHAMYAAIPSIR